MKPILEVGDKTSLNHLISHLLETFQALAVKQNSLFINDVPEKLFVSADKHLLASIMSDLFGSVISKSKDCCIRISAKTFKNTILIHVRDNSNHNREIILQSLGELQNIVEKLSGGCIHVNQLREKCTTLTLSFSNSPCAA